MTGTLMGTDSNGNQFYENKEEIYGARRAFFVLNRCFLGLIAFRCCSIQAPTASSCTRSGAWALCWFYPLPGVALWRTMADRRIPLSCRDYDASSVTPAWHKWLHSMANDVPSSADVTHKWQAPGTPNLTATPVRVGASGRSQVAKTASQTESVPDSTVQPKLHSWVPPKN